jgi:hypothetical protein
MSFFRRISWLRVALAWGVFTLLMLVLVTGSPSQELRRCTGARYYWVRWSTG